MEAGHCFKNSYLYLVEKSPRSYLVHGILTNPSGKKICHAWIEHEAYLINPLAYDPSYDETRNRIEFYHDYKIENIRRYTLEQAYRLAQESDLFGPWDLVSLTHLERTTRPHSSTPRSKAWKKRLFRNATKEVSNEKCV